jgi:hypothetical protein
MRPDAHRVYGRLDRREPADHDDDRCGRHSLDLWNQFEPVSVAQAEINDRKIWATCARDLERSPGVHCRKKFEIFSRLMHVSTKHQLLVIYSERRPNRPVHLLTSTTPDRTRPEFGRGAPRARKIRASVPFMGKIRAMGTTYMDFGSGVFHVDGDAPLTQEQVDSVWLHLPTTGASWVERGRLFVQQRDGATAFNLGPVEPGIKGVSDSVRLHGKAGVKKSKTQHSTRKARQHSAKKKSPAQLDREIAKVVPGWAKGLDLSESRALAQRLHVSQAEIEAKERRSESDRRARCCRRAESLPDTHRKRDSTEHLRAGTQGCGQDQGPNTGRGSSQVRRVPSVAALKD